MHIRQVMILAVLAAFVLMAVLLAQADDDNLSVSVNSTNYEPSVNTCVTAVNSTSPTEGANATVTVRFNVSDTNGVNDLNNSLAKAEFDDNTASFAAAFNNSINSTCSSADANATTRQYECGVPFEFWQPSGNYSLRCYGGDKNDSIQATKDNPGVMEYTRLIASSVDFTTVSFGVLTSSDYNTNATDIYSPINITNTGNVALTSLSITGANLTAAGRTDINISRFYAGNTSSAQSAQALNTSKQQISGVTVPVGDNNYGRNNAGLWVFFAVPATLESGGYAATWTLFEEE